MTRQEAIETLRLTGNPSEAEIRRAHLEATKRYHPDRYATLDEPVREVMAEKMRRVNEARAALLGEEGQEHGTPNSDPEMQPHERLYRAPNNYTGEVPPGRKPVTLQYIDGLVREFLQSHRFDMADKTINNYIRANGELPELLLLKAIVLEHNLQFDDALALLKRLHENDSRLREDPAFNEHIAKVAQAIAQSELPTQQNHQGFDPDFGTFKGFMKEFVSGFKELVSSPDQKRPQEPTPPTLYFVEGAQRVAGPFTVPELFREGLSLTMKVSRHMKGPFVTAYWVPELRDAIGRRCSWHDSSGYRCTQLREGEKDSLCPTHLRLRET